MTPERVRERAEEIDNTVLQQVTNRGLAPGYVRDLVLAAVNEALTDQERKCFEEKVELTKELTRPLLIPDGADGALKLITERHNVLRAALGEIEGKVLDLNGEIPLWESETIAIIARAREGAER